MVSLHRYHNGSMSAHSCHVLLVDNDPTALGILPELIARHLSRHCTHAFNSVQSALGHLERHRADLVVCDSNLPLQDGLTFIQRAKTYRPRAIFLLVASRWDWSLVENALKLGAYGIVSKPFDRAHFLLLIKHGCDASALARSVYVRRLRLARLTRRINSFESALADPDRPIVTTHPAIAALIQQSRSHTKLSRESLHRSLTILRGDLARIEAALLDSERRLQTLYDVGSNLTWDTLFREDQYQRNSALKPLITTRIAPPLLPSVKNENDNTPTK